MSDDRELIAHLGQWEGYRVGAVRRWNDGADGPGARVWIELHPLPDRRRICDGCGGDATRTYDSHERWIRDLPVFDARTVLLVHRCRVECPSCGVRIERLSWLDAHARVTKRLAESVAMLCAKMSVKHVAGFYDLDWKTVKNIDKAFLFRRLGPPDLSGIEVIAMDEFAIRRGHRYATVVADPYTRRVLWVGKDRTGEGLRPFFELLGEEGRRRLKAVVMDMHGPWEQEIRRQCPGAQIVYDLFHVVAKYSREVIDRVRVDEANRLGDDRSRRKVIKGARWLLLRNAENVTAPEDRVRLQDLLDANANLAVAYVLKDDLKQLWNFRKPRQAWEFFAEWSMRAWDSGVEPLRRFAVALARKIRGVIAHCRWPLGTSFLEGINNKIKVLKRMAYGFRDDDYFFLKIRVAFHGDGR